MGRQKHAAAFTLAEVLLTLTIVGIIASLTIPELICSMKESEYKIRWKKAYSAVNQAFIYASQDIGSPITEDAFLGLPVSERIVLFEKISKQFNVIRNCGYRNSGAACYIEPGHPDFDYVNAFGVPMATCKIDWGKVFGAGQFQLADGMFLMTGGGNGGGSDAVYVWVDTNGPKKGPNQAGKDLQGMQLVGRVLVPLGSPLSNVNSMSYCESNISLYTVRCAGCGCSAKILTGN